MLLWNLLSFLKGGFMDNLEGFLGGFMENCVVSYIKLSGFTCFHAIVQHPESSLKPFTRGLWAGHPSGIDPQTSGKDAPNRYFPNVPM